MNIHKQYGIYFESQRSHIISNLINFKSLLKFLSIPSDPEADDFPMCHHAHFVPY